MAVIEIIISAIGMLLIPSIIGLFNYIKKRKENKLRVEKEKHLLEKQKQKDFKNEVTNEVLKLLKDYYSRLDDLSERTSLELKQLRDRLSHRAEIAKLKYDDIWDKLESIEDYLERTNGFRRKKRHQLADPKATGGDFDDFDDDDLTGDLR